MRSIFILFLFFLYTEQIEITSSDQKYIVTEYDQEWEKIGKITNNCNKLYYIEMDHTRTFNSERDILRVEYILCHLSDESEYDLYMRIGLKSEMNKQSYAKRTSLKCFYFRLTFYDKYLNIYNYIDYCIVTDNLDYKIYYNFVKKYGKLYNYEFEDIILL